MEAISERFSDFLSKVESQQDTTQKVHLVDEYVNKVTHYGLAVVEDSSVVFLYRGTAKHVRIPSDLNGWDPNADAMTMLQGTNLFYLVKTIDCAARFEYKFSVDSVWTLDPLNKQTVMSSFGANSEIWMPGYQPPNEIIHRDNIPQGEIDTFAIKSNLLYRTHQVFVYLPPGYKQSNQNYPSIYVTDGGEYISLALMPNVLDNMIADDRIAPVVAIFIDPRSGPRDSETNMRMIDYAMSDTFVNFLIDEVRVKLTEQYRLHNTPDHTAIMGASLGGLISAYAAYKRPDVFGLCAAQSPSFNWEKDRILHLIEAGSREAIKFYIDTGTLHDAEIASRRMKKILQDKGYELSYAEYPEGHNWSNWRARIDDILTYFWGAK